MSDIVDKSSSYSLKTVEKKCLYLHDVWLFDLEFDQLRL